MRGFYLDANGDVEIRKNDIAVASGLELNMQKICQVLRTNCGEWWANPKEGIPMRQILKKNPDMGRVRDCIRKAVLCVDPGLQLTAYSARAEGRMLVVDFSVSDGKLGASASLEV